MGVCYVAVDVPVPSTRGSSTHVVGLAKSLEQLGTDVFVLTRRTGSWQPAQEKFEGFCLTRVYRGILSPLTSPSKGVQVSEGPAQRRTLLSIFYRVYLSTVLALYCGIVAARIIRKNKLNVVIERETSYGAGALASVMTGAPLILEANGPSFSPISSRRASRIISYSYSLVGERLRSKTSLIDSGVDVEVFRPDESARRFIRTKLALGDSPVVGYVGTFQVWHGVDDLVLASERIITKHPAVKFLMVGPGFESTQVLARQKGVIDSFVFAGPVPHDVVPQFINAADVMVSPANPSKGSWTRTYGLPTQVKIFEYMACGKPVVATSVGPLQRLVKNEETGLLVHPGDTASLGEAICRLIEDKALARSLADKGYRSVLREYTWSKHAKEVYGTIRTALEDQ